MKSGRLEKLVKYLSQIFFEIDVLQKGIITYDQFTNYIQGQSIVNTFMSEIKQDTIKEYSRRGNKVVSMVTEKKKKDSDADRASFIGTEHSKKKSVKKIKPYEFEQAIYNPKIDLIAKFEAESNFLQFINPNTWKYEKRLDVKLDIQKFPLELSEEEQQDQHLKQKLFLKLKKKIFVISFSKFPLHLTKPSIYPVQRNGHIAHCDK